MTIERGPLILVGPSGSGKTTIARRLVEAHPDRFRFSVSATTRAPRPGEEDGVDYHFVGREQFQKMAEYGDLAEWAEVHGELYGTPLASLLGGGEEAARAVLDIDIQGARQVAERLDRADVIFILPPRADEWMRRLLDRATETPEELIRRLRTAVDELETASMFTEFVVNTRIDEAVEDVSAVASGSALGGVSSLAAEGLCSELAEGARMKIRSLEEEGPAT